uniref:InaF motif containing 2 n=1 Tax=Lepisosteus oculatus TaxID=7918 RepID=W5NM09_LEPOC
MRGASNDRKEHVGAEKRPSYPGDQRVKVANTATKKWVKVAMAITYFLSVSLASFVLVIYYGVFWSPKAGNSASNSTTNSTGPNTTTTCS